MDMTDGQIVQRDKTIERKTNYINRLEQKVADYKALIADVHNELTALMAYLDSPKFCGPPDSNGTDRDFVSAREMRNRIATLRSSIILG